MSTLEIAPTPERAGYSGVAIVLHWLIAALLVFEVALGLNMEDARGSAKFAVFQLHKSVGITILLLVLLRIVWRFHRRPPPLTATGWERALAQVVHGSFYALLLALPISGWIVVSASKIAVPTLLYGTIPWPHLPGFAAMAAATKGVWYEAGKFVHANLVNLAYLLVALHVAGALKHHFFDRDGELARMVPGTRAGSWNDPRLLLIAVAALAAAALGLGWGAVGAKRSETVVQPVAAPAELSAPAPATVEPTPEASSGPAAEATPGATPEPADEVSSWAIQPGSSLRFRTSYSGDAITGSFATFGGDIVFAPDRLDMSRVAVTIDLGSAASGDGERDETLKGVDFFAVQANRNAVFRAERFRKTGTDRYVADGTLRLKGVTTPLSLPFTLRIDGDNATMQGSATIDRLTYKIGEGEFSSTAEIPAAVGLEIALKARRK